ELCDGSGKCGDSRHGIEEGSELPTEQHALTVFELGSLKLQDLTDAFHPAREAEEQATLGPAVIRHRGSARLSADRRDRLGPDAAGRRPSHGHDPDSQLAA